MATRDQIRTRVLKNLREANAVFFTTDEIDDWIQDGYDEVCLLARTREKVTTVSWVSDLVYYNFYQLITDYFAPHSVFDKVTNTWLDCNHILDFQAVDDRWETRNDSPIAFAPVDFRYLAFYPHRATASGQFEFFYFGIANTLTGSTVPTLPNPNSRILEYYATGIALEHAEEIEKARQWLRNYFEELDKARENVSERFGPDRIIQLRADYYGNNAQIHKS